ncbi:hypothetical protein SLS60_006867 [Paraconiothyrium brasiliense]|uniref:Ankyrin repeat protein n=1 Tax=Paraconiothyrium brasiliense TaxID=300254 RepID=A0ABR3R7S2_9PLEO
MLDERAANVNLKKEFGTTLSQATVAAAAAISGRLDSIENSIKSHIEAIAKLVKQENMWQTSAAFGTPFNAAVSSGSEAIVVRALKAVRDMAPSPNSAVVDALLNGLGTSLHRGRTTMALDILRDGSTHFPKVKAHTFKLWLDKAMAIGDLSLLGTILGLNHSAGRPGLGDSFVKACKNGQDSILGVFFGQNLLNINDYVNVSKATMSPTHCYPIMAAIRCAPSAAARAVLDTRLLELGANPNGPKKPIGMQVSAIPLAMAAEKNCCATVEVLLANGADLMMPTARDSEWNAKFGVLRGIKNLLRTAPFNEFRYKVDQALKLEESLPVAPLVLAVRDRCWGAVAHLLTKGVDLTMPTDNMGATGEWRAVVDIIYGQFNDESERGMLPDHVWQTLDAIRRQLASTHEPWPVSFHRPVSYGTAASTHEPWPVSYHRPVPYGTASFPPLDASYQV